MMDSSRKTATPAFSRRLRRASILAQKILSTSQQATIDLPPWQPRRGTRTSAPTTSGMAGFKSSISRTDFESLCSSKIWDGVVEHVEQVLRLANEKKEDIDTILVTGGAMSIPKLRQVLGDCFAGQRDRIVDLPKHTTAIGAALIATPQSVELQEPTPLALDIRSSSGDILVIVPPSTPVPTRQTRIYYASCQSEISFDILEGLTDPEQEMNRSSGINPTSLEHCMGRVLIDGSRASSPLILKLEIAFEIDAADCLTVVISDNSNNRTTRLEIAADETCLSAEAITLCKMSLGEVLRNGVATNASGAPSFSPVLTATPLELMDMRDKCPIESLRECVATLKPMVLANRLSVCIPPGDLFVLRSKMELASSWLDQIDSNQPWSQNTDKQLHTAHEYLHQICLLNLSITANSAVAQLRQELNLLN